MTETQRVPAPRLPLSGHGTFAVLVLVGIVSALIMKPWGVAAPAADAGVSAPPATGVAPSARPTPIEAGFAYDPRVFGPFEPAPEWSVWPGGFFVTILYVTREAHEEPSPPPAASGAPPALPSAPPGPAAPADSWPASITIGPGDHLLWLGLDTPLAFSVSDATVWRLHEDGDRSAVPVVRLPSHWGPNFAVIGIPVAPGSDRLAVWPQGRYEVAVRLDPTGERRTLIVEIHTLADPAYGTSSDHPH